MFSENSLKLIATMMDGVQLKPLAENFAMMAQGFEILKKELKEAFETLNKEKETKKDGND